MTAPPPRAYAVEFTKAAAKALVQLPAKVQRQVGATIDELAQSPRPQACTKLKGEENLWRVYSGNYRVIYSIEDRKVLILIVTIGHRKDIYRNL